MKVRQCARSAFTLVELTVGAAVASIVFAALAIGAVSLQKTFVAVDTYGGAQGDQMRALDYMTRDIRRSQSVTVVASPPTITLTAQTYNNSSTGLPNNPTISSGAITYGGTSTITYALSGTSLTRTEGSKSLVVGTNVTSFTPQIDPGDATGKTVDLQLQFNASFKWALNNTTQYTLKAKAKARR